jgi:hypothetical protein
LFVPGLSCSPHARRAGRNFTKAEPGGNTSRQAENRSFVFRGTSMPQFAENLAALIQVDRPVLDTGAAKAGRDAPDRLCMASSDGKLVDMLRTKPQLSPSLDNTNRQNLKTR